MSIEVQQLLVAVATLSPDQKLELAKALQGAASQIPPRDPELILSVCGKYAHLPTSSEEFMARRREDMQSEN